ncbi:MAG TPA: NeuD/PglB/VioB family sugar acetyltransferase [Verrucomicrobiae bacterium]|nr:NeuD/PglB/VioB family sugar acetyltransferase [Verrucomicrobiae bacterium]
MKDIVIVGHGGLAKEVAFLIEEINRHRPTWNLRGYISAQRSEVGTRVGKYSVIETDGWLERSRDNLAVAIAIGQTNVLKALHVRLRANTSLEFPNLLHPGAMGDWGQITLGHGNVIMGGASFTTQIAIGSLNIVNPGCTVAHDCVLGSYNLVNPAASLSGQVALGDEIMVGTGARILQGLRVCDHAVIGAGAVVTRNIETPGVYIGVPARVMEKRS